MALKSFLRPSRGRIPLPAAQPRVASLPRAARDCVDPAPSPQEALGISLLLWLFVAVPLCCDASFLCAMTSHIEKRIFLAELLQHDLGARTIKLSRACFEFDDMLIRCRTSRRVLRQCDQPERD